jgi:pre-60S factor REI1
MGALCLFCDKQFSDGRKCQQHMLDKSHCMMNMDDEEEYLEFYDFTKTYENHPELAGAVKEEGEEKKVETIKEEDEWDDCELEDEDMASDEEVKEDQISFQIVSDKESGTSKSFTIVDKPETETDSYIIESESSAKPKEKREKGPTKEEVFLNLKIKKAKLLPSGEVLLGNGKIMGHRQFWYIYKQKPRLPDTREAVIVNKLALEYRKLRMIQNGGVGDSLFKAQELEFQARMRFSKMDKKRQHRIAE